MELEFKTHPARSERCDSSGDRAKRTPLLARPAVAREEVDGSEPQSVAKFFGACDIAYSSPRRPRGGDIHGDLNIFVFSDDIGWARQNAGAFETERSSVQVIDEAPLQSFYLMRLCKHFITANSTFSWWAAWLGGIR